jgi:hypothetical protein
MIIGALFGKPTATIIIGSEPSDQRNPLQRVRIPLPRLFFLDALHDLQPISSNIVIFLAPFCSMSQVFPSL